MQASYDLGLVLASYLVASFAAFTMLDLAARVSSARNRRAGLGWLCAGAIAMGLGIWAMHFIGMLALHLGVPLLFDLPLTLLSMGPAIGASALALSFLRQAQATIPMRAVAALAMGAGIAAMHYTGMAALEMAPGYHYDWGIVAISVLIAVGASFVALTVALRLRHTSMQEALAPRVAASLVMGVAVAGMHYTGMNATRFAEGSICVAPRYGLGGGWLALLVGAAATGLMLLTLAASMTDAHLLRAKRRRDAMLLRRATQRAAARAQQLQAVEAQTRSIVASSLDCIISMDAEGRIVEFNPAAETTFGCTRSEVLGRMLAECVIPPAQREAHRAGLARLLAGAEARVLGKRVEVNAWRSDGTEFPVELAITATPLGGQPGFTAHLRDLSARRCAEQALRLHSLALSSVATGICIVDLHAPGQPIEYVNPAFERISGWTADRLVGHGLQALAERPEGAALVELLRTAEVGGGMARRQGYKRADGRQLWCDLFITPLQQAGGGTSHNVIVVSDSTATVDHEQRLEQLANFDSLTGLPNRMQLRERLERRIRQEAERGPFALLFIDLDRFKHINDSLGHDAGDALLKTVTQRLLSCVRGGDLVARLGGDEFVVMVEMNGPGGAAGDAAAGLQALLSRLRERVGQAVTLKRRRLHVTCSIGVSQFPEDGHDAATLLRKADAAMYLAKREGRNEARAFTGELEQAIRERFDFEVELRQSLLDGGFELHFQPLVRLADGAVFGAEALVRWKHPRLGLVMPDRFIELAEETGLIVPLGDWVLTEACRQARSWRAPDGSPLQVSVNVSPRQLQDAEFAERLGRLLAETGLPPDRLELEITESLFTDDTSASAGNLRRIAEMGVRLAIDDFGTGYSNLSKLKRFTVSRLKIDRSFMQQLEPGSGNAAIATAIIALGTGLGIEVIGEGVETEAQRRWLLAAGCRQAQGWLFGRAEPVEQFVARHLGRAPAATGARVVSLRAPAAGSPRP
ncbi:EAL domain-containing protein [Burkholderiaceae bacterium UC74_6]